MSNTVTHEQALIARLAPGYAGCSKNEARIGDDHLGAGVMFWGLGKHRDDRDWEFGKWEGDGWGMEYIWLQPVDVKGNKKP